NRQGAKCATPRPAKPINPTPDGGTMQPQQIDQVIRKLEALPPERVTEVEDFIDFLSQRDNEHKLARAAMAATEPTLNAIWDNTDDAEYDNL
ncbi:MAG: hypothetical protein P8Y27_08445, partial [Chromatiaceae bacterium]